MELKTGYQLTEVGIIPEDWKVVTATQACDLVVDCKNRTPPLVFESDYAVVRTSNVRNGQFILEDLRFTDEASYHEWTARAVPQFGDIMITREAPLGEVCAVPQGRKVCLGQRMMLYRPSPTKTNYSYLLYSLMSFPVKANLLRKVGGSTVGHAKVDDIRFLQLPLPPLPEQNEIATALSDMDELLGALDRLIAKKRDLKQVAMQQLLTGKTRLPGFGKGKGYEQTEVGEIPEDWDVKPLKEISPQQSVGLVINPSTYFDKEGTIPMLVGSNISENKIDWASAKKITEDSNQKLPASRLSAGDLVMVRVGDPGTTAVIPPEFDGCNCASMMIVRKHPSFDSEWLCFVMNSPLGRSQVAGVQYGTAQKQFNISDAVDFRYPVPSLSEQRAIATVLSDMDAEITTLEQRRDKTRALKQAMMQELLTGRIRLV